MEKPKVKNSAIKWYDFTGNYKGFTLQQMVKLIPKYNDFMSEFCSNYACQIEEGTVNKTLHFQGRIQLKKPLRSTTLINKSSKFAIHLSFSQTKTININNFEYVTKEHTKVYPTWGNYPKSKNEIYIPKQYRNIEEENLKPFQKSLLEIATTWSSRAIIDVVITEKGNIGKSTIQHLLRLKWGSILIQAVNDGDKAMIQEVQNKLSSKKIRQNVCIVYDLPRAFEKHKFKDIALTIESIGSGYVCDNRNKTKEWDFDTPRQIITCNFKPNLKHLSEDRWKLWTIDDNFELIEYIEEDEVKKKSVLELPIFLPDTEEDEDD